MFLWLLRLHFSMILGMAMRTGPVAHCNIDVRWVKIYLHGFQKIIHTHIYIFIYLFIPIDIRTSESTYMYFRISRHIYTHNMYTNIYIYEYKIYYTYTTTMTFTNLKVLPLLQCNMPLSWAADPCLTDWFKALSLEKSAGNHGETMVIWEWFSTGFTTLSQCSLWIFSQKPVESGEPMSQNLCKKKVLIKKNRHAMT